MDFGSIGGTNPANDKTTQFKVHNWAKSALENSKEMKENSNKADYLKSSMEDIIEYTSTKDMGLYMDIKKSYNKAVKRAGTQSFSTQMVAYTTAMTTVAGMTSPGAAAVLGTIGKFLGN